MWVIFLALNMICPLTTFLFCSHNDVWDTVLFSTSRYMNFWFDLKAELNAVQQAYPSLKVHSYLSYPQSQLWVTQDSVSLSVFLFYKQKWMWMWTYSSANQQYPQTWCSHNKLSQLGSLTNTNAFNVTELDKLPSVRQLATSFHWRKCHRLDYKNIMCNSPNACEVVKAQHHRSCFPRVLWWHIWDLSCAQSATNNSNRGSQERSLILSRSRFWRETHYNICN